MALYNLQAIPEITPCLDYLRYNAGGFVNTVVNASDNPDADALVSGRIGTNPSSIARNRF